MRGKKTKYEIYIANDQSACLPRGDIYGQEDEFILEKGLGTLCLPHSFPLCLAMRAIIKYLESSWNPLMATGSMLFISPNSQPLSYLPTVLPSDREVLAVVV